MPIIPFLPSLYKLWKLEYYTDSHFQPVRFQQAPGYSEKIYLHQINWLQCEKVQLQQAPTYNEPSILHLFTHCKRDPLSHLVKQVFYN